MRYKLPILAYHKVDPRRELGITSISPQRFEKQIGFLKSEGYVSISPFSLTAEPIEFRCSGLEKPSDVRLNPRFKPMLITFDDGYEGIYTYAYPILKKYNLTAIVFLTSGYIGKHNSWDASPGPRFRHLDWKRIREMADDGIWFGSHGVNHKFLTRQDSKSAKFEIAESKKILEDGLGKAVYFFSYPYGNYDDRIVNIIKEAGYKAAFSLRPELITIGFDSKSTSDDKNERVNDRYALPRIAIYLIDNMWFFKLKIGNTYKNSLFNVQKMTNRLVNRCSYASVLVEMLKSRRIR